MVKKRLGLHGRTGTLYIVQSPIVETTYDMFYAREGVTVELGMESGRYLAKKLLEFLGRFRKEGLEEEYSWILTVADPGAILHGRQVGDIAEIRLLQDKVIGHLLVDEDQAEDWITLLEDWQKTL